MIDDLAKLLDEQPTAYDIDKVIAELEEKIADMNFCEYRDAFIDALEIVKQGGVSDDVCEWKIDGVYLFAQHNNKPFVSCVIDEGYRYNYCPVCGKKIKAVES